MNRAPRCLGPRRSDLPLGSRYAPLAARAVTDTHGDVINASRAEHGNRPSEPAGLRMSFGSAEKVATGERRREHALQAAFVGTHALVVVRGGRSVSLVDPPEEMSAAAASCVNVHTYPVLIGDPGDAARCDTLLSSPLILYDFPSIPLDRRGSTDISASSTGSEGASRKG